MGHLLLAGGAEFGGRMATPDRKALVLAGGSEARVLILPTAAVPDNNQRRAGENGLRWFRGLGARSIQIAPLIDRASASDAGVADLLRRANLIYLLGGFTRYLVETLHGSLAWSAAEEAWQAGAVIAGSSAGAMALCEHVYDPTNGQVIPGLGLVPNACVLPHHDTFGRRWAEPLGDLLPGAVLLGIDERTAVINNGLDGKWQVYGQGGVTIYQEGKSRLYPAGRAFAL